MTAVNATIINSYRSQGSPRPVRSCTNTQLSRLNLNPKLFSSISILLNPYLAATFHLFFFLKLTQLRLNGSEIPCSFPAADMCTGCLCLGFQYFHIDLACISHGQPQTVEKKGKQRMTQPLTLLAHTISQIPRLVNIKPRHTLRCE